MTKITTKNKYKGNPRKITEKRFNILQGNIEDLGDLSGVTFCNNNKAFVSGNQRSEIFNGAEIQYIETYSEPTACHTLAHGFIIYKGEKHAYREVFFTEDQFKNACIAANNNGGSNDYDILSNGEWDIPLLNNDVFIPDMDIEDLSELNKSESESEQETGLLKDRKKRTGIFVELNDIQMQDLHTAIDAMKQTKEYEFAESETDDASTAIWLICQAYNKTL